MLAGAGAVLVVLGIAGLSALPIAANLIRRGLDERAGEECGASEEGGHGHSDGEKLEAGSERHAHAQRGPR